MSSLHLVLLAPLVQIIQSLGCVLPLTAEQRFRPLVHLSQKQLCKKYIITNEDDLRHDLYVLP